MHSNRKIRGTSNININRCNNVDIGINIKNNSIANLKSTSMTKMTINIVANNTRESTSYNKIGSVRDIDTKSRLYRYVMIHSTSKCATKIIIIR